LISQTVIAERTSYSSVDGGVLADGKERQVGDLDYSGGEGQPATG